MLENIINLVKAGTTTDKPPPTVTEELTNLFSEDGKQTLKETCRAGLRKEVRKDIWLRLVLGNGYEEKREEAEDKYREIVNDLFKGAKDPAEVVPTELIPDFGSPIKLDAPIKIKLGGHAMNSMKTMIVVLAHQHPEINFCPLMVSLVPILLHEGLSDALVYTMISEMLSRSERDQYYFTISGNSFSRVVLTFSILCQVKMSRLFAHMLKIGIHPARIFQSWFARLYMGYCTSSVLKRLLDIYFHDGQVVLLSFGLGILKTYDTILLRCKTKEQFLVNVTLLMQMEDADGVIATVIDFHLKRKQVIKLNNSHRPLKSLPRARIETFHFPDFDATTSELMNLRECIYLWSWIPTSFAIYNPVLLFSTQKNGYLLKTLLEKCAERPHVLLVKDASQSVFGVFVMQWSKDENRDLRCFVFTLRSPGTITRESPSKSSSHRKLEFFKPTIYRPKRFQPQKTSHTIPSILEKNTSLSVPNVSLSALSSGSSSTTISSSGISSSGTSSSSSSSEARSGFSLFSRKDDNLRIHEAAMESSVLHGVPTYTFHDEVFDSSKLAVELRSLLESMDMKSMLADQEVKLAATDAPLMSIAKKLSENKIQSIPMVTNVKNKQYLGTVEVLDVINEMLSRIPEDLKACKFGVDASKRLSECGRLAQSVVFTPQPDTFSPLHEHYSLAALVLWFATGQARAPILTAKKTVMGVVSQSEVIKYLSHHMDHPALKYIFSVTIEKSVLQRSKIATLRDTDTVLAGIKRIDELAVGGLPLVDEKGVLVGNFSASDGSALFSERSKWALLIQPIKHYLASYHPNSLHSIVLRPSSTLGDALSLLVEKKVHRVWVVDHESKPVGLVTPNDLIDAVRWSLEGQGGGGVGHASRRSSMEVIPGGDESKIRDKIVDDDKAFFSVAASRARQSEIQSLSTYDDPLSHSNHGSSSSMSSTGTRSRASSIGHEQEGRLPHSRSSIGNENEFYDSIIPEEKEKKRDKLKDTRKDSPVLKGRSITSPNSLSSISENKQQQEEQIAMIITEETISLGETDGAAFSIDAGLKYAWTKATVVFGNPPLSSNARLNKDGRVDILAIECWGFE